MLGHRGGAARRAGSGWAAPHAVGERSVPWLSKGANQRDFYVRQLRHMKSSAIIEDFSAADLRAYGRVCGWALARAHARSGDAAMIAGYIRSSEVFEDALCDFAVDYADQSDRDYKAFFKAVREGRIKATMEG